MTLSFSLAIRVFPELSATEKRNSPPFTTPAMYLPLGENRGSIIAPGISRLEIFLELTWKYQSSPFKAKHKLSPLLALTKVETIYVLL